MRFFFTICMVCFALLQSAVAQELSPRAYWPLPKETNLVVFGYQLSTGDVVADAALPILGVKSDTNFLQVTYQRTTSFFDRSANVQINLPYAWGSSGGIANGQVQDRDISAMSDARFRFSVNLLGAPSMDAAGFQALRAKPRTILGTSLLVQIPTGGYDSGELINAGSNRWAVKPAIGLIWPVRPSWLVEAELGVWIYGDNDDFLGVTQKQDPVVSSQLHLVKRIRPGYWASLDATYYAGGSTTVGNRPESDLQRNSRIGATLVFPLLGRHGLKVNYSTEVKSENGGDFDIFAINYLYSWH